MDCFDLKNPVLADVLLSAPDTHDRLQASARMEGYQHVTHSPTCDELWVPSNGEEFVRTPSDIAPPATLYLPSYSSASYAPPPMFAAPAPTETQGYTRGPVAAPFAAFPSVDALLFKRVKAEGEAPSPLSPPLAAPQEREDEEDEDDDEAELSRQSPPPTRARDSPLTSARAARAASRGKRSPSSDHEYIVPFSPSMRGPETRRRKCERTASKGVCEPHLTEEERLEKNRQSARDCRLRKKRYVESLERRLAESERRETVLTQTIARLEDQIAALQQRHH